jgi:hypothetical protein
MFITEVAAKPVPETVTVVAEGPVVGFKVIAGTTTVVTVKEAEPEPELASVAKTV